MCKARKGESQCAVEIICLFWEVRGCMAAVLLCCFSTNAK